MPDDQLDMGAEQTALTATQLDARRMVEGQVEPAGHILVLAGGIDDGDLRLIGVELPCEHVRDNGAADPTANDDNTLRHRTISCSMLFHCGR